MPACTDCNREFPSDSELQRHKNRKIPCTKGKYKCDGCLFGFTTKRSLTAHIKEGRCKGKQRGIVEAELQQENADLKDLVQQQEQLMQMTNKVTAAAAQNLTVQNIDNSVSIGTQNNVTINVENLLVVNPIGQEDLKHLTAEEICQRLKFVEAPEVLGKWCALLRADENHPANHNALLLNTESKHMYLCRQDIGWTIGDRKQIMEELLGHDVLRLYNTIGSKFENNPDAMRFKNQYLLHGVMAMINSGDKVGMQPAMKALAEPIVKLTNEVYAEVQAEERTPAYMEMEEILKSMQKAQQDLEDYVRLQRAVQNENMIKLRRTMATLAHSTHPEQCNESASQHVTSQ